MNGKIKRFLAALLAAVMMVTMMPTVSLADDIIQEENITVEEDTVNSEETSVADEQTAGKDNITAVIINDEDEVAVQSAVTAEDAVAQVGDAYYATLKEAVRAANAGDTVTLLKNTNEIVSISKSITLDLGGKTLDGKTYNSSEIYALQAINAGDVTVKNGKINGRVDVFDATAMTIASDVTITNAPAEGKTYCYGIGVIGGISGTNSGSPTLNLYGKVSVTGDSIAVATNGLDKTNPHINVYDGAELKAEEQESIALYFPAGVLNISGGTFSGVTAVYFKSTDMTIAGGTFIGTGLGNYKFNGNGANPTGDAVVIDNCNYPAGIGTVLIAAGCFKSVKAKPIGSYMGNGQTAALTKFVRGGSFSSEPDAELLVDGYSVIAGDVSGYPYAVGKKSATDPASVIVKNTTTSVESNVPQAAKAAIDAVKDKISIDGIAEAVAANKQEIVKKSGIDTTDADRIEISIEVRVEVTDAVLSGDTQSVTFKANPIATVVAKQGNTVKAEGVVQVTNDILKQPITVRLPLPAGFTPKQIKHVSGWSNLYPDEYFLAEAQKGAKTFKIEDDCAVFDITHFSTFEMSNVQTYAAIYNITVDQGTVSASTVKAGEKFTLTAPADKADAKFVAWIGNDGKVYREGENTYSYNGDLVLTAVFDNDTNTDTDTKYCIVRYMNPDGKSVFYTDIVEKGTTHKIYDQYPNGALPNWFTSMDCDVEVTGQNLTITENTNYYSAAAQEYYQVTLNNPTNGTLTAADNSMDLTKVTAGTEVVVKAEAADGYAINSVTGDKVTLKQTSKAGEYSFTMPAENVTITATFKAAKTYTVKFYDANNQEITANTLTVQNGKTFKLPAPVQGNKNQTFLAWRGTDGKVYKAQGTYTANFSDAVSEIQMRPLFDTDTQYYLVRYYDVDGSLFNMALVKRADTGNTTHEISFTMPKGSDGMWYSDNSFNTVVTGTQTITGLTNYYAKAKEVTVTYDGADDATYTYGDKFTTKDKPFTLFKTFVGWLGSNGKVYQAATEYKVDFTEDIDLTALYDNNTEYYIVKYYDVDGSVYNVDAVAKADADTYKLSDKYPQYAKKQWYSDPDFQTKAENVILDRNMEFYSCAAENKVTLTDDGNGTLTAVDGTIDLSKVTAGTEVVVKAEAKTGYAIDSVTSDDVTLKQTGKAGEYSFIMPAENVTINAAFKVLTHNVFFYNEGKLVSKIEVEHGQKIGTLPTVPEKTGYETGKWVDENGAEVTEDTEITATSVFNTSYETKKTYTVTYEVPAGYTAPTAQTVAYSDKVTVSESENVVAWIASDGRLMTPNKEYVVTDNLTLTAVMDDQIVVTYKDMNGHVVDYDRADKNSTYTVKTNNFPTVEGYTNLAWQYNGANAATVDVQNDDIVLTLTGDAVESAITSATANLTNAVAVPDGAVTVQANAKYGENVTVTVKGSPAVAAGDNETKMWAFAKLTVTDADGNAYTVNTKTVGSEFQFTMPAKDVTVTAHYINVPKDSFFVKFIADGELVKTAIVKDGETLADDQKPAEPTKTGYTFDKWTTDGAAKADFSAPITEDTEFYAHFEANHSSLTFDANGGAFDGDDTVAVEYGDTVTLRPAPTTAPENKKFVGWRDESTGLVYAADAQYTYVNSDAAVTNITFTAIWAPEAQYTVIFRDEKGAIHGYYIVDKGELSPTAPAPVPPTGKMFDCWYDEVNHEEVDANDATMTRIYEDRTYVAQYTDNEYTLTVDPADSTDVDTSAVYHYGDVVTFTVNEDVEHVAQSVYISYDDENGKTVREQIYEANGEYVFKMPAANATIHVVYAPTYGVYTEASGNGTVTANSDEVAEGGLVELTATPAQDNRLKSWYYVTDGGVKHELEVNGSEDEQYAYFTMPGYGIKVYAEFIPTKYSIDWKSIDQDESVVESGTEGIDPKAEQHVGDPVTLNYATPENYDFVKIVAVGKTTGKEYPVETVAAGQYKLAEMPEEEVTFVITLKAKMHTIYFMTEDGTSLVDKFEVKHNTASGKDAPAIPEKTGYDKTNAQWLDVNGNAYDKDAVVTADNTYYATDYTATDVTVTFRSADNNVIAAETVKYGEKITPADVNFNGAIDLNDVAYWLSSDGRLMKSDKGYKVTENIELTAIMKQPGKIIVTYRDMNGKVIGCDLVDENKPFTTRGHEDVTGYSDLKWSYGDSKTADLNSEIAGGFDKDITLTLTGTKTQYTVTYTNANGAVSVAHGSIVNVTVVKPTVPNTIKDYAFKGITVVGDSGTAYTINAKKLGEEYNFTMPTENVTVKADFIEVPKDSFVVKFKANGYLADVQTVVDGGKATAPAAPEKTGYDFIGWKLDDNIVNVADTVITKDTTFVAQYEAQDIDLFFDPANGEPTTYTGVKYGETTLKAAPTKENMKFIGWQDDNTGLIYKGEATYEATRDTTFTAVWVPAKLYVVTFTDATGALHGYNIVKKGDSVTAPAAPTPAPTGKTFVEWKSGNNVADAGETIDNVQADAAYVAQYKNNSYKLSVQDVSGGTTVDSSVNTAKVEYDSDVSVKVNEVVNGQKVTGVYLSYGDTYKPLKEENGTYSFKMPGADAEVIVVREDWMHTITFNVDGKLYQTVSVKHGDQIPTPVEPTKAGYTFEGWNDGTTTVTALPTAEQDAAYEAVFTQNNYTITVDKGSVNPDSVHYGDKFTLTAPTGKDAKNFVGWAGSDDKFYTEGTHTFKGDADLTLTAIYNENTEYYVVKFVYPNNEVYDFTIVEKNAADNKITIPAVPEYTGYTVNGWSVDGDNTIYNNPTEYPVTSDVTFKLNVTVKTSTITVDDGAVNGAKSAKVEYGKTFTLTAPAAQEGKNFLGWAGDNGNFYIADTQYTFYGETDLNLTAVYENDTRYTLAKFYAADGETLVNVRLIASGETKITLPGTTTDEWTYRSTAGYDMNVYGAAPNFDITGVEPEADGSYVFTAVAKEYHVSWKTVDEDGKEITNSGVTGTITQTKIAAGEPATVKFSGLDETKYTLKTVYAVGKTTGQFYGVTNTAGTNEYVINSMPNEDVTFVFVLATNKYSVIFKTAEGTILQSGSYAKDEAVAIPQADAEKAAKPGYKFTGWAEVGNAKNTLTKDQATYTVTNKNVVFAAQYEANNYTISTDNQPNVTIKPDATQAQAGGQVTFTVSPAEGYALKDVYVKENTDGKLVPIAFDGTQYEFTMPANDVTIYATVEKKQYTVTFVDDDNTLLGTAAVDHNDVIAAGDVPAIPVREGYDFAGWITVPENKAFDPNTAKITGNLTVKATYVGLAHTVVKGVDPNAEGEDITANVKELAAWETTPNDKANSVDLFGTTKNTLETKTGEVVYFEVSPKTGYSIKNIYVTAADGSQISVDLHTYKYDKATDHYIMYFTMPNKDMQINVETQQKQYMVTVTGTPAQGGTHKINGYSTDKHKLAKDEAVEIPVTAKQGYVIEKIETSYVANDETGRPTVVNTVGTIYDGNGAEVDGLGKDISDKNLTEATLKFNMVAYDVEVTITYKALTYNVDVIETNEENYRPVITVNGSDIQASPDESYDPNTTSKGVVHLTDKDGMDKGLLSDRTVGSGKITVPGDERYEVGSDVHFAVSAYTGYEVESVTAYYDNGTKSAPCTKDKDNDSLYHFTMPGQDVTIIAAFKEVRNDVIKDAADEEHGKVVVSEIARGTTDSKASNAKRTSVQYKNDVQVSVTPDAGYYVTNISYELADGTVKDFHYQDGADKPEYNSDKAASSEYAADPGQDDTAHEINFTMPATDVELNVEYAPINYVIGTNYKADQVTVDISNDTDGRAALDEANVGDKIFVATDAKHGYDVQKVYVLNNVTGETVGIHSESTEAENGGTYSFTMPSEDVTVYVVTVKHAFNVIYRDSAGDETSEQVKYQETTTKAGELPTNAPTGYHFVGWSSEDVADNSKHPSTDNADFVIVKDTVIEAQYEKDETDVIFGDTDNGQIVYTGKQDGYKTYTDDTKVFGDTVKFKAVPDDGYVVDTITVSTKNSEGEAYKVDFKDKANNDLSHECEFQIPATYKASVDSVNSEPIQINVTFKKAAYLLTDKTKTHHGEVSVNGQVTTQTQFGYNYQDDVTITVTPDEGYYVASITADGSVFHESVTGTNPGVDGVGDPLTMQFKMPSEDVDFKVEYQKIDYSITNVPVPAEGGSVTTTPTDKAQMGDVVYAHVAPAQGYELKKLTVTYENGQKSVLPTLVGTNEYAFTMPAAGVTVTAEFQTVAYNVTAEINGKGTFTINGDYTKATTSKYLDTVTVNVKPDDGWRVQSVVANDGTVAVTDAGNNNYTFTMPSKNVNVVITLEKIPYSVDSFAVNYYENGHGTVTADKKTANVGDKITITADPDQGYHVKDIKVVDKQGNSVPVSVVSEDKDYTKVYSFTMPAEAVDVTVNFAVDASSYYTDVRTDKWYHDAVEFVTDRGYFKGVDTDKFGPMINMSRGMFVTVLGRIDADINGLDVSGYDIANTSFTDVNASQYYAPYIAWAAENGIVNGRNASQFDPNGNVSRQEMAAIMYRYCTYLGLDMTLKNQDFMNRYTDVDQIHGYAKTAMQWAVGTGLMQGVSSTELSPKTYATRAQVAQIIKNLSDKVLFNQG